MTNTVTSINARRMRANVAPPIAPAMYQMNEIGSSGKGVGSGTVALVGGFLTAERASKNAGSRELLSAVALPEKNARFIA